MKPIRDISGERFGRLTVIRYSHKTPIKNGKYYNFWVCKCDCGVEKTINVNSLKNGDTKSCGCLNMEVVKLLGITHGLLKEYKRENSSWMAMKQRCNNKNTKQYADYGGRGIGYAKAWERFENFVRDMGHCPRGMTLERKNNEIGYSKSNCVWATKIDQQNNRRNNVWITWKGETKTITQWARILGLKNWTLYYRLKTKMPIERAMSPFTLTKAI